MHGYVAHCVEFLCEKDKKKQKKKGGGCQHYEYVLYVHLIIHCTARCGLYLVGFGIAGGLGVFCLFDVFHHFPNEGVAVVLILAHDDLQDKPQSPNKEGDVTSVYRTFYHNTHVFSP